jgi:creatinine amidohydrolase/Fe(II)-dependent formamide hydrolase-like protein
MIQDWNLATTNLARTAERHYEVAVLPLAAIEPHNRHLPHGQDLYHTIAIAERCCEAAWARCESVVCLPAIPYGVDCNLLWTMLYRWGRLRGKRLPPPGETILACGAAWL